MGQIVYDYTVLVAIDFDGTITKKDDFINKEIIFNKKAIKYIQKIRKLPVKMILWTCRENEKLEVAVNELKKIGIEFDYLNQDNGKRRIHKKISADFYIDDRGNDHRIRWRRIYKLIKKEVKKNESITI